MFSSVLGDHVISVHGSFEGPVDYLIPQIPANSGQFPEIPRQNPLLADVEIHSKVNQGRLDIRIQINIVVDGSGVVGRIVHNDLVRLDGNSCFEEVVDGVAGEDQAVLPPRLPPGWFLLVNEHGPNLQIQAPFQRNRNRRVKNTPHAVLKHSFVSHLATRVSPAHSVQL